MLFPSDVLCNEAGQGVLRQRVKNAVNSLNRDWNFCSYSTEGSRFVFFVFVADIEHINKRVTITGNARTFKSTSIVITIEEVTQIVRRGKVTQHQTMEELMF